MNTFLGAVLCPHPPLLLRELSGQQDPIPDLRAACHQALDTLLSWRPDHLHVVGRGDPAEEDPPWSLRVARRLLAEAGRRGDFDWHPVAGTATAADCDRLADDLAHPRKRTALLVLADGSASRTPKAPGYLDERAVPFDVAITHALETNDPTALTHLDPTLSDALRAQGRPALHTLGAVMQRFPNRATPHLHYIDDPFGVLYLVATWPCTTDTPGSATPGRAEVRSSLALNHPAPAEDVDDHPDP
ncbi:hypothetical protein QRX50_37930 [Amycolatopsis carbonis]|uniref:Uncharacterized protein n=1 Tax=Amycolatopsis carbonis TaxID=715471 RepID=A0A9Y2MVV9_9PSEU|nr:hypothetical protein [Amycolatopsis sp. 2-15]WIX77142.1 hypothetical protein QRX50_37930 [Amycolatopsis sp. 2-15]